MRKLNRVSQRLKEWFHRPYQRMLRDHPRVAETQPFEYVRFEAFDQYIHESIIAVSK